MQEPDGVQEVEVELVHNDSRSSYLTIRSPQSLRQYQFS
jgi:hypothetical protein